MYNRLKKLLKSSGKTRREDRTDNEANESIRNDDEDDEEDDAVYEVKKNSILLSTFRKGLRTPSMDGASFERITLSRSIGGDGVSTILSQIDSANLDEAAVSKHGAQQPLAGSKAGSSHRASVVVNGTASETIFEQLAKFYEQFPGLRTEVRILTADNVIVYLLGTNHADPQCPVDVANIIHTVQPRVVVIELCAWRACGCPLHRGNVFQTKPEFTFRYLRRVVSQIGFLPAMIFFTDAFNEYTAVTDNLLSYGSEFAVAARLCDELASCRILLGDREIPITVRRQASAMGNWRGIRICVLVTLALLFKRHMRALLLRGHRLVIKDPRFYQIVVLERDIFLTYMIQLAATMERGAESQQIVVVVGQGHLNGIQSFWGKIVPQILPFILRSEVDY